MTRAERLAQVREQLRIATENGFPSPNLEWLLADIARLESALRAARLNHRENGCDVSDCPKAYHPTHPVCECGADDHNAAIDAALGDTK